MKTVRFPVLAVAVLIVFGLLMAVPFSVQAAKTDLVSVEAEEPADIVYLTMGKAKILPLEEGVADVMLANPTIVDIVAVQADQLYLVGLNVGDTNIILLDSQGNTIRQMEVHVKIDLTVIQDYVDRTFPDEDVTLTMLHDQLIVTGRVSTPDVANRIISIVGHYYGDIMDFGGSTPIDEMLYNMLEVRGEQQVMLRVRIMEVSRSILKELGPETVTVTDIGDLLGDEITGSFARSVGGGSSGGVSEPGFGEMSVTSSLGAFGPVAMVFEALEEDGLANILAEPNLTAISGEQAGFLAGGEFPVPSSLDNNGNVVVEFRSFGVALNFLPRVLSEERILLQLNTEVSSLDRTESVTIAGLEIPALDIRRASTTVEIGSGSSLMIAGLLQSETSQGLASLPGVMDTPVLGDLLKSDNFQRRETELVVIVTPFVVRPYEAENFSDKDIPANLPNPLAQAFAANLERRFAVDDKGIFGNDERYGYLLD